MSMLAARLRARARLLLGAARLPEVYGISYPKSGRTWLRAMMGCVLCRRSGLPESDLLDTRLLTAAARLPVMSWHHGGGSLRNPCPGSGELSFDHRRFAGKAVIFLMRDPRDALVSAYFQASKRIRSFEGPIDAFVRSDQRGIMKWIAHHNAWYEHRALLKSFHLVRYEALHSDPVGTLRSVMAAIGLADPQDEELEEAVDFARFDNLKQFESAARSRAQALRPRDGIDPDSYKVRKGRVGGFGEYLTESDVGFIQEALRQFACPLYFQHYLQPPAEASA
jgi:hypothetical protein